MNTLKITLMIAIVFLGLSSCDKQLNVNPTSTVTAANYWKTEEEARGALYGMYDLLRTQVRNRSIPSLGSSRGEVLTAGLGGAPTVIMSNQLSPSIMDNNEKVSFINWVGLYKIIYHANSLIKYVPDIKFNNEEKKNSILAQAYAMRAYIYFLLTRAWGKAIINAEPTTNLDPKKIQKERSPINEVFKLIKSDLKKSLNFFSDNTIPKGRNVWSKPSVNTLKANVYLWTAKKEGGGTADLKTALSALNEVIKKADVKLLDDYKKVFDYDNKGNKEILFAVHFAQFESSNYWGQRGYMNSNYVPSNITDESREALGVMGENVGGAFAISEVTRKQFHSDDQRGEGATFKNIYVNDSGKIKRLFNYISKYDGTVINGIRRFLDDYIIYRYADVLLMKAEAKNALEQDPADEINQIRKRAYGNNYNDHIFVSRSKEYNDKVILQERAFELAFEGKRWFDLLRFHKAFDLVPSLQDRKGQDYLELFPIPAHIISLNPKLSQNPGY